MLFLLRIRKRRGSGSADSCVEGIFWPISLTITLGIIFAECITGRKKGVVKKEPALCDMCRKESNDGPYR